MKTAIVTGGSRGIGRAICLELAKTGANIVVGYAGSERAARETAEACVNLGARAVAVRGDVAQKEDCEALVAAALEQFGGVDILVNNAGITRDNLLLRMTEDEWSSVIDTNLRGAYYMTQAVTRTMMRARYGRIINIASVVGLSGNAGQANYAASKAGLIGLTKSVARELATRGVTVNAVAPGFIQTDMTAALPEEAVKRLLADIPQARLGTAEDVAHAVAFLADERAAYITGQVLSVDGGMAMR